MPEIEEMSKLKPTFVTSTYPLSPRLLKESKKLFSLIKKSKSFLISSTLTSDGDSIGAQLGLVALIKALRAGKKSEIVLVNQSPVPERYKFLMGSSAIISRDDYQESRIFDLGLVCDGGIERTGNVQELFTRVNASAIVDHHAVGSTLAYDSRVVDTEASSSCELVYLLMELSRTKLTKAVAEALYIGMVFDTGFFKHSLTKPRTHLAAAKLIETGIDFSKISDRALLDRTWKAQLLLKTLMVNMEALSDQRLIVSCWSKRDLDAIDPEDGDQEGMINQLYYTDSAEVVVLFTEGDDAIKVSMRSKGRVNVADFARSLTPDGGGHFRAAGCTLSGSLDDVKRNVVSKLRALVDELPKQELSVV